mgnify:CR=1 FL=1
MAITAAQVKELREMTGAGMMDCKKALTETDGDMDAAVEFLRENGLAKAAKKAGRIAAEGLVAVAVSEDAAAIWNHVYNCRKSRIYYSILYYHCSNFGIIFRKKVRIIRLDQRCDRTCRTLFFMHYGRIFDWKRGYLCIFRCNCIFDSYFSDRLFYTI